MISFANRSRVYIFTSVFHYETELVIIIENVVHLYCMLGMFWLSSAALGKELLTLEINEK